MTGASHGLCETAAIDVADRVPIAVDEQYRLAQASTVWRRVCIGDVCAVVQIPGVAWAETGVAEGFDQGIEVRGRPERGDRRCRRRTMCRTIPTSISRDHSGWGDLARGRRAPWPKDRCHGRRNV